MMKNNSTILSLDDFGSSPKANRNILDIVASGKISRVSVMMNGVFTPEETEKLLASGVKIDIHLDITEEVEQNRKLKKGDFGRIILFIFNYLSGKTSSRKIEKIWGKQIEEFEKKFRRTPDGINTHEHIHFFPPYFQVALRLAEKHDIPYVRLGKKSYPSANPVAIILNFLRKLNRKHLRRYGLSSSDFVVSSDWIPGFGFEKCKNNPFACPGTEIIFHPERNEEFEYLKDNL